MSSSILPFSNGLWEAPPVPARTLFHSSAPQPTSSGRSRCLTGKRHSLHRGIRGGTSPGSKASVQHLCSSEQQPVPEREEKEKKEPSLEPSGRKDAIPGASSSRDERVVPPFLLAPLIFCSSASRPTQRGSSLSLAAALEQDEDARITLRASEPSRRAETAKVTAGRLG